MAEAKRTNPELWEKVKAEVTAGGKGGDPGEWSARKAQMAVQEYKRRGGRYDDKKGPKKEDTSLHKWTEEDWGTKSGDESGETGERYLPREVRMLLTEDEYRRTTRKKRGGKGQFVDQPPDVAEKAAHIREHGPTKAMLDERARELDIDGRSSMSADELHKAIEAATDENGRARKGKAGRGGGRAAKGTAGDGATKAELMARARERDIPGRSRMSKDELARALGA